MNKACEISIQELVKIKYLIKKIKFNNKNHSLLANNNITRMYGRGMEYAESRIYQPGDDIKHIDWHLSAKQNKTYTKLYHEEKGENYFIILDLSKTLYFGSKYYLKSVIASNLAAFFAYLSYEENNNIASLIFNDHNLSYTSSMLSNKNILNILNNIIKNYNLEQILNKSSNNNANNLYKVLQKYTSILKNNSKVFIISDFFNLDEITLSTIKKISSNNLTYLIKVSDPIENSSSDIGDGVYNISDNNNSTGLIINKNNRDLILNYFKDKNKILNSIKKDLTKLNKNIKIIDIESNPNWYNQLIQYI